MDQGEALQTGAAGRLVDRALDRVLAVQEPLVRAHVRRATTKRPGAGPEELVRVLERHFLTTVTVGGGAVGVAAAVPGVGTATALAISGAETIGFVEATSLFAHSITEVHGISRVDPERTQSLVLALMLGQEGASLVRQFSGQARGGAGRPAFWGEFLTSSLPRQAVGPVLDRLRSEFVKRLASVGSASVIGKAIPYGVGAVVGGTGNHILGRGVVRASRRAFGPAPLVLPEHLQLEAAAEWDTSQPRKRLIIPGFSRKTRAAQDPTSGVDPFVGAPPAEQPRYAPPPALSPGRP